MTGGLEPRPYIVTIQDGERTEIVEHVVAFNIIEAATEANVRVVAKKTAEPLTALDIRPDMDALAENLAVQSKKLSDLLTNV